MVKLAANTGAGSQRTNTTFYLFSHGKDGAFPISDWYNFTTIQRYKTLDADDAEERYAQRGKILNKWAVMVNKKLKPEDEGSEGVEEEEKKEKPPVQTQMQQLARFFLLNQVFEFS